MVTGGACGCTGGVNGRGSGGWAAGADPAKPGALAQAAQAAAQQGERVIQPASREAIAEAEEAIRTVVESVDQGEPCWYYVDPQVTAPSCDACNPPHAPPSSLTAMCGGGGCGKRAVCPMQLLAQNPP